ncbi:hypothetical protein [Marinimicrobium sp. ABcell2]|uniref:hypothetical protein n=1 Tax=Marinimicrobium sp. ABcell2 TaxID=3069751 RepID=UPI0027B0F9DF|nr:hypothetical protein [Marinimicrobium sp. ABcell2]MDQ2075471.1 hypothetical protein [Marinimicrobium sp. ABcell2]
MTPDFQRREANHLTSGEWVQIIAINRATGYIASERVQLTDASQTGGMLSVSLTSDQLIQLYTEWYDHDGRPLPEGLGVNQGADYGLTGRLARVVDTNLLEPVARGGLANFPIAPEGELIPEMHDPLLNDPDVLQ